MGRNAGDEENFTGNGEKFLKKAKKFPLNVGFSHICTDS